MTCRELEYSAALMLPRNPRLRLREYDLEPLTSKQQQKLVRRWFAADGQKRRDILQLIGGHDQLQDMASNGLMLTLICSTRERHDSIGPNTRRVQLYDLILRDIVSAVRRGAPVTRDVAIRRLAALREVAWSFFQSQPSNMSLDADLFAKRLKKACKGQQNMPFDAFYGHLRREGLLVVNRDDVRFLHRSFFEYLAGSAIARSRPEVMKATIREHVTNGAWRGALMMALAYLGLILKDRQLDGWAEPGRVQAGHVVDDIVHDPPGPPGVAVAFVGDAVVDGGLDCVPEETLQRLRIALLRVMRDDAHVPPKIRASAGSALGRLGDPRFDETLFYLPTFQSDPDEDGNLKPEPALGFIEIPEGDFWMGSNLK